jgi:hypothetical protein
MNDAASAATLTGGLVLGLLVGGREIYQRVRLSSGRRLRPRHTRMSGLTALCFAKSEAHPYRGRGSKLTSAWFHHKFRLRRDRPWAVYF